MKHILYGSNDKFTNITDIAIIHLSDDNIITIKRGDKWKRKFFLFGNPTIKNVIKIIDNDKEQIYDSNTTLRLNLHDFKEHPGYILKQKHNSLSINNGNFLTELNEQLFAIKYIKPDDIVLEFGGNIGRNSLIISSILNDSKNLVTFESNNIYVSKLKENRDINNFNFSIIPKALSEQKLIQKQWHTLPLLDNNIPPKWKLIDTITYSEFKKQYPLNFNVLIADCEGALYFILKSYPDLLNGINKIIIENDFNNNTQKQFVHNEFMKHNLKVIESNDVRNKKKHIKDFFQIWIK